jgi:hypothetical protein
MRSALLKLTAVTAFLCCLGWFISLTDSDGWLTLWFVLFIFVGLPLFVMSWIDLGKSLREADSPSRFVLTLGMLLGVPQALLGLISMALGTAIVAWVVYNSFIERQPEYSGGFLTFGLGPTLILVGWYWLRQAFARSPELRDE